MRRVALYVRVSTVDQNLTTQIYDLEELARQRQLRIVARYEDKISGAKARRPGLDQLMHDARRHHFDTLIVWSCDRLARSVKHFLEVLDELARLNVEFVSFREQLDTGGALGRAVITIISVVAELERSLIIERVRAGMRRARLEGTHIGRPALNIDRDAVLRQRAHGQSLTQIAKTFNIGRATVSRVIKEAKEASYGEQSQLQSAS